jgi:hypothetical protein
VTITEIKDEESTSVTEKTPLINSNEDEEKTHYKSFSNA